MLMIIFIIAAVFIIAGLLFVPILPAKKQPISRVPQSAIDNWNKPQVDLDAIIRLTPEELSDSIMGKLEKQWETEHPSEADKLRADLAERDKLISSKSALIANLMRDKELLQKQMAKVPYIPGGIIMEKGKQLPVTGEGWEALYREIEKTYLDILKDKPWY